MWSLMPLLCLDLWPLSSIAHLCASAVARLMLSLCGHRSQGKLRSRKITTMGCSRGMSALFALFDLFLLFPFKQVATSACAVWQDGQRLCSTVCTLLSLSLSHIHFLSLKIERTISKANGDQRMRQTGPLLPFSSLDLGLRLSLSLSRFCVRMYTFVFGRELACGMYLVEMARVWGAWVCWRRR